jgi:hypothetical protein
MPPDPVAGRERLDVLVPLADRGPPALDQLEDGAGRLGEVIWIDRFGTSSATGAPRRLLPRATSIMRNVCLVAARPSAENVTGTRMASAIISAVASVGMWSGGRSSTTRRSSPASSPARAGQRPEP